MGDKSVAMKLGLKPGLTLLVRHAPVPIDVLLGDLPDGASYVESGPGPFPLALLFARNRATMVGELPAVVVLLQPRGALWLGYAKGTSPLATDINRDSIRDYGSTIRLETVAQIALDADWSALRFKIL